MIHVNLLFLRSMMNPIPTLKSLLLLCICGFFAMCSSTNSPEASADTREWVQGAYDSIDYSQLAVIFNERRANELKAKIDVETDPGTKLNMSMDYARELLRAGKTLEALQNFSAISNYIAQNNIPIEPAVKKEMLSLIAVTFLRHGEIENCVRNHNHESCILPISGEGVHDVPDGSANAITQYENLLKEFPDDIESKYLLNIAYMTLGKYPDQVPKAYLMDPAWFTSTKKIQRWEDIAGRLGINKRSHAGGSLLDDINNDGWQDIVITSWGPDDEMTLFLNNGNGTFTDKTAEWGLSGHKACLQLTKADYNNDGWIDILMLRGGWYQAVGDIPKTLLMNTGKGFVDVTKQSGIVKRAGSQAAAWADFDLDGWVDVVIANESQENYARGIDLYMNQKNGSFTHESQAYGLTMNHYFKGVTAADVNNDRYPDLYFSSLREGNFLFVNQDAGGGKRKFVEVTGAGVSSPRRSFPCWSFDFNNDGLEDLFASGYDNALTPGVYWVQSKEGKADPEFLPKLYANRGNLKFEEVGKAMGLNEVAFTMGCNFGDINSDGFLDFFLSTGNPKYQSLVPNKMYMNIDGKRFEDVSYSGGFSNIQKGHGTSFGDLDHDGDEDMYVVIGGAFDGDFYYNSFYENPNEEKNNWLVLDLEGTTANKKAIGARVAITVDENGKERMIYRTVTTGASFGGNSFALEVGLRKATSVKQVVVQWPCLSCPDQTFTGMEINKAYKLTEGQAAVTSLPYEKVRFGSSGHAEHVQ